MDLGLRFGAFESSSTLHRMTMLSSGSLAPLAALTGALALAADGWPLPWYHAWYSNF